MCRYSSGTHTMTSTYGAVPTDFIMDNVNCDGSEGNLFDCDYLPTHNCGAHEGAGVLCQTRGSGASGSYFGDPTGIADHNDRTMGLAATIEKMIVE